MLSDNIVRINIKIILTSSRLFLLSVFKPQEMKFKKKTANKLLRSSGNSLPCLGRALILLAFYVYICICIYRRASSPNLCSALNATTTPSARTTSRRARAHASHSGAHKTYSRLIRVYCSIYDAVRCCELVATRGNIVMAFVKYGLRAQTQPEGAMHHRTTQRT